MKQSNRLVIKKLFKKIITLTENRYSKTNHLHDDRYYTETEINAKVNALNTAINGKAASNHTHNYAASNHTHNYAASNHTHNYAASNHNHDTSYVKKNETADSALKLSSTLITANTNLNNIIALGDYHCAEDAVARSLANCPITNAFAMQVFKWANSTDVIQEITQYNPGINKRFVRSRHSQTGWGAWMEIINSGSFRDYFIESFMIKSTYVEIAKSVEITEMGFRKYINTKSITENKSCYIIPFKYGIVGNPFNCFSFNMNGGVDNITLIVHNHGLPSYKNICLSGTSVIIDMYFLAIPR